MSSVPEVGSAPLSALRAPRLRLSDLDGYDLLLVGLLAMSAAARLWQTPGYFRADSWLALVTGRDVWQMGVPHSESLTALSAGASWIDQQWLSQLSIFAMYRVGGLPLIAIVTVTLTAGSFGAMVVGSRRMGASARAVLLVMPLTAFPFMAQTYQPRTQMLAYPLFVAVFLLLLSDARRSTARVYVTLPLLVLWANIHGSVVLGAALVVLRACTLGWERWRQSRARSMPRWWKRPVVLGLLAPMTVLLTPYGAGILPYYHDTLFTPAFKDLATEWQPVWSDPVLAVPLAAVACLWTWGLARSWRTTRAWDLLAMLVLLVGGVMAVRNVVWVSLAAVPILGVALSARQPSTHPRTRRTQQLNVGLAVSGLVAASLATLVTAARPADRFVRAFPDRLAAQTRAAVAAHPKLRVIADIDLADWLLWRVPSLRGRVAFDARLELLPAAGIKTVASIYQTSHAAGNLAADRYRLFALDERSAAPLVQHLEQERGSRVLFRGDGRILILRAAPGV